MNRISTKIRLTELADLATRLCSSYEENTELQHDAFLKKNFSLIKEQTISLVQSISKDTAVSNLKQADKQRDTAVLSLSNLLVGYRSAPHQATKESATLLYQIFTKYGTKITRESYSSSTSLIDSMLRDFAQEEAQKHIETLLYVKESIAQVAKEQEAFVKERKKYEKELSVQTSTPSATQLKKPLMNLINIKIIYYLTAMEGDTQYESLSNMVKQMIDSTNLTIQRRSKEPSTAKASKKEKTTKADENTLEV